MNSLFERNAAPIGIASGIAAAKFKLLPAEKTELLALKAEVATLAERRAHHSAGSARKRLKLALADAAADPTEAGFAKLAEHSKEESETIARTIRTACREAQRQLGPRVAAAIIPPYKRLAAGLQSAVVELELRERAAAEEAEVFFGPSPMLRALQRRIEITHDAILLAQKAPQLLPMQIPDHGRALGVV